MRLIIFCTILMILGFIYASPRQKVLELENGERRRLLRKSSAIYLAAVLVIISTLRYGFVDTYAYKHMYEAVRNNYDYIYTGAGWNVEIGWLFLNYVLNFISRSPKLMLFLSALIINVAFMKSAQRYSEDACLSFFLYFCLLYLDTNNGVRQMVSAAIVILAIPVLLRKKYLLFLLLVLIAFQLHNSAIVWIIIMVAAVGKPLNIRTLLALALGVLFLFIPGAVTGLINDTLEFGHYNGYLEWQGGMKLARALVTGILPGGLSVYYYFMKKREGYDFNPAESMMLNLVVINTMFVLMGTYMQVWNRFAFYTFFAMIAMIPKLVREVFGNGTYYKGRLRTIMIALYFLYFCYNLYTNSGLPGAGSDSLQKFYIEWWC